MPVGCVGRLFETATTRESFACCMGSKGARGAGLGCAGLCGVVSAGVGLCSFPLCGELRTTYFRTVCSTLVPYFVAVGCNFRTVRTVL